MKVEKIKVMKKTPFKRKSSNKLKKNIKKEKPNLSGINKKKNITTPLNTDKWTMQWYDNATQEQKTSWEFGTPEFKYCKKRKEFFSKEFPEIWYKSPYKYNMFLEAKNLNVDNLMVYLDIIYEDGNPLKDGIEGVSRSENYFSLKKTSPKTQQQQQQQHLFNRHSTTMQMMVINNSQLTTSAPTTTQQADKEYEVKLGPFFFKVCSYKHDGKKFRILVYFVVPGQGNPVCALVSPSFLMKAKKPICNPGIKKRKRKYQQFMNSNAGSRNKDIKSVSSSSSQLLRNIKQPSIWNQSSQLYAATNISGTQQPFTTNYNNGGGGDFHAIKKKKVILPSRENNYFVYSQNIYKSQEKPILKKKQNNTYNMMMFNNKPNFSTSYAQQNNNIYGLNPVIKKEPINDHFSFENYRPMKTVKQEEVNNGEEIEEYLKTFENLNEEQQNMALNGLFDSCELDVKLGKVDSFNFEDEKKFFLNDGTDSFQLQQNNSKLSDDNLSYFQNVEPNVSLDSLFAN